MSCYQGRRLLCIRACYYSYYYFFIEIAKSIVISQSTHLLPVIEPTPAQWSKIDNGRMYTLTIQIMNFTHDLKKYSTW